VRNEVDDAFEIAQHRGPKRDVLDQTGSIADFHHIVDAVLILQQNHEPGEIVLDEVLGAEGDGQAEDSGTAHQGHDGNSNLIEYHQTAAAED
jgi:hypothetical protein